MLPAFGRFLNMLCVKMCFVVFFVVCFVSQLCVSTCASYLENRGKPTRREELGGRSSAGEARREAPPPVSYLAPPSEGESLREELGALREEVTREFALSGVRGPFV